MTDEPARHDLISTAAPLPVPAGDAVSIVEADTDARFIDIWLHGRAGRTRRAYRADAAAFRGFTRRPLRQITLGDLQAYQDSLARLATATRARRISAVKSLLSFGHRTGYLPLNVGAAVTPPKIKQTLAERILSEDDVVRTLALERHKRNRAILRLLYLGGLRISELCALKGRDLQPRDDAGQVTVFGKGGKTRAVLLKPSIWRELAALRGSDSDQPVFRSRKGGGHLDPVQVHRIVKAAAARAGLSAAVSAHWLRHAHVSHALDHGAPARAWRGPWTRIELLFRAEE